MKNILGDCLKMTIDKLINYVIARAQFCACFKGAADTLYSMKYSDYEYSKEIREVIFSTYNLNRICQRARSSEIASFYKTIGNELDGIIKETYCSAHFDVDQLKKDYLDAVKFEIMNYDSEFASLCELSEITTAQDDIIKSLYKKVDGIIKHINEITKPDPLIRLRTYEEINRELINISRNNKKIDLRFFDFQYDSFDKYLKNIVPGKSLTVSGNYFKETLFAVVETLHRLGFTPLVVDSLDSWNRICGLNQSLESDYVFINGFNNEEFPINNSCYSVIIRNRLMGTEQGYVLDTRMRADVVSALGRYGYDTSDAWDIVDENNNQYGLYRRQLFNINYSRPIDDSKIDLSLFLGLCLINKVFAESKHDTSLEFLNRITKGKYVAKDIEKLQKATRTDGSSFIVKLSTIYGENYYKIANIHDGWDFISNYQDEEFFKSILKRFVNALPKLIFEAGKNGYGYSYNYTHDILESLFVMSQRVKGLYEKKAISKILSKLRDDVGNAKHIAIASSLRDLAIVSPEAVFDLMNDELEYSLLHEKIGFISWFVAKNNLYHNVLFACYIFICVESLKDRIGRFLFNLYCISDEKLAYSNHPLEVLDYVYMAYCQNTFLSNDEKIRDLRSFIAIDSKRAFILLEHLQYTEHKSWMVEQNRRLKSLRKTFAVYTLNDSFFLFEEYARLLVETANNPDDFVDILGNQIIYQYVSLFERVEQRILEVSSMWDDLSNATIYAAVRRRLYHSRYFGGTHSVGLLDGRLEQLLNHISFENGIYRYFYILKSENWSLPILDPVPYSEDGGSENEGKIARDIRAAIEDIVTQKYDVSPLIEHVRTNGPCNYDFVFELLYRTFSNRDQMVNYIYGEFHDCTSLVHQFASWCKKTYGDAFDNLKYVIRFHNPLWISALASCVQFDCQNRNHFDFLITNFSDLSILYFTNHCFFFSENFETYSFFADATVKSKNWPGLLQIIFDFIKWNPSKVEWVTEEFKYLDFIESLDPYLLEQVYLFIRRNNSEDSTKNDSILWSKMIKVELSISADYGSKIYRHFTNLYFTLHTEDLMNCYLNMYNREFKLPFLGEDFNSDAMFRYLWDNRFYPCVSADKLKKWLGIFINHNETNSKYIRDRIFASIFLNAPKNDFGVPVKSVCDAFEAIIDKSLRSEITVAILNSKGMHIVDGQSLFKMADYYSKVAERLEEYPKLQQIYQDISSDYEGHAKRERDSLV